MDQEVQIDTFSRFTQVSRETITSLKKYEEMLIKANESLNLIGKSTIPQLWIRHYLDSAQVIDFIDKNTNSMIDIGTGAGFPGLVLAILSKDRNMGINIKLVEKSKKKTKFLEKVNDELKLNVKIFNENIFEDKKKIVDDLIIARAFKPLQIILELIHKKAENWKKIFIFLGKSGKQELLQASKSWDIEYKQRMSVTSSDSLIIEISELKKK